MDETQIVVDRDLRAYPLRVKRLRFTDLQPGSITVTDKGVVIGVVTKPL